MFTSQPEAYALSSSVQSNRVEDAWAERVIQALAASGCIPTRQVIDAAMAAAIPPIGTPTVIQWSGRRRYEPPWLGLVAGQYLTGFTIRVQPGGYLRFVSYVDLWCRHAEVDEPPAAAARIKAIRHILHTRMPSATRAGA